MKPLVALALLLPALALAQDSAPQLQEDPRAAKFRDVERGFFVGFEAGYLGFLETPAPSEEFPLAADAYGDGASGPVVGVVVGVDIGKRLALSLFGQVAHTKSNPDYGAFSLYAGGFDVKISVYGKRDRNDWERFWVFVHGRGGIAKTSPEGLFGTDEVIFAGGPGIEYYTRLRHFSIGLTADYVYAAEAGVGGYAVYPTVRYTF